MKFFDAKVDLSDYVETLVIPKGDQTFIFKARPVTASDYEEFDGFCKQPEPPKFFVPGGGEEVDTENEGFIQACNDYATKRAGFMFMRSLDVTEGLTWDTVIADDPSTWENMQTELQAAGFADQEITHVFNLIITANGLDSDKIEKATASFLASVESQ